MGYLKIQKEVLSNNSARIKEKEEEMIYLVEKNVICIKWRYQILQA